MHPSDPKPLKDENELANDEPDDGSLSRAGAWLVAALNPLSAPRDAPIVHPILGVDMRQELETAEAQAAADQAPAAGGWYSLLQHFAENYTKRRWLCSWFRLINILMHKNRNGGGGRR